MLKKLSLIFTMFFIAGCIKTSPSFQRDADIIRLQHLKYYGELIEQYYKKAGKYPFQGQEEVPIYVHVANDEQEKFTKPGPDYAHVTLPFSSFVKEVESILGHEINEYYDPQYRPSYKPNFYIYMIHKDTYFFAIHIHQPFPFAKKVGKHYHKVEISNHPNDQNRAISPKAIFTSDEFQQELQKNIQKKDFFKEREDKYIHFTKQSA